MKRAWYWPVTVIVPPPSLAVVSWCSRLTVFYIHWLDFFIYSRYDQVKDLAEEGGCLLQFMQTHRCRYCLQITMQLILIMSRNHGWLRECNMNVRKTILLCKELKKPDQTNKNKNVNWKTVRNFKIDYYQFILLLLKDNKIIWTHGKY